MSDEETKSAYVPPYRRGQESSPSKFQQFLSSHSDRFVDGSRGADFCKAESDWGSRDHRSGWIDRETFEEEEKLFEGHSVETGLNFEKYDDIPV
jgi:ATP-dependent RNA helicase DDX3X